MRSGVNDESIAGIIDIVNEDGSFQGINYDDLSREAGFPHGVIRGILSAWQGHTIVNHPGTTRMKILKILLSEDLSSG
jgi:hypothetical protein